MGKAVKDQLGRIVPENQDTGTPPVVILVGTQLGENIGGAARAMLNFGLTELRLVKPRDGWPSDPAVAMAAGATSVLDNAKLFDTTAEAIADLQVLMAATARRRELQIPVLGTGAAGSRFRDWSASGLRSGILFGPEKAGLTNDDVSLCDHIITYPINPAFQSLNLAQAVGVFSYIWAAAETTIAPDVFDDVQGAPAERKDLENMFAHLEGGLDEGRFFYPREKKPMMVRNIRAPFIRAKMTEQEVRTMRGVIKTLIKGRGGKA